MRARTPLTHLSISLVALVLGACDLGSYGANGTGADGGVGGGGTFVPPDAQFTPECGSCHGDQNSPAPPKSISGSTDTTSIGVGAHRSHLNPTPTWHAPVPCAACHAVPATTDAPGHIDGDNIAEVIFSSIAGAAGVSPTWDRNSTTCSVYCHGASLTGGVLTQPNWTVVDGSQKQCGNCHGAPPPDPHPQSTDCGQCHPTIQPGTNTFLDPASHINGVVDLKPDADGACDSCHGSGGNAAPPKDLAGNTAKSAPGVGAHRDHLGTSTWRREITCSQCHVVPTTVGSPGHLDGDNIAEVIFDGLSSGAVYTKSTTTCSNVYCHGNGYNTTGTMNWTQDLTLNCDSCHNSSTLSGQSGDHRRHRNQSCNECHESVVDANKNIIAADLHVDGIKQVKIRRGGTFDPATRRCTNLACHENETW